jgi:hypothetical protein
MNISRAYMALAMLAKHDGVKDIKTTQPGGIWRRELGDWVITLNGNLEPRAAPGTTTYIPPCTALLECQGWPCGLLDPVGGAIASLGGASEDKLMADIEAEIGMTVEAAMEVAA